MTSVSVAALHAASYEGEFVAFENGITVTCACIASSAKTELVPLAIRGRKRIHTETVEKIERAYRWFKGRILHVFVDPEHFSKSILK
jgi:hypothetical protein